MGLNIGQKTANALPMHLWKRAVPVQGTYFKRSQKSSKNKKLSVRMFMEEGRLAVSEEKMWSHHHSYF